MLRKVNKESEAVLQVNTKKRRINSNKCFKGGQQK